MPEATLRTCARKLQDCPANAICSVALDKAPIPRAIDHDCSSEIGVDSRRRNSGDSAKAVVVTGSLSCDYDPADRIETSSNGHRNWFANAAVVVIGSAVILEAFI